MDKVQLNGHKRAVLVARVSTSKQAERGNPETQLAKSRTYCDDNGFTVVEELTDVISGTVPILERPAGKRLYEIIEGRLADVVAFYTNERTARDDYSIEYLLLKDKVYSQGLELHYADTGKDEPTLAGNIVGYIKQQAAAEERRKILERTMRKKIAIAESGKWVGSGGVRFGYTRVGRGKDGRLVIDEDRAAVVREVFAWFVGVNGQKPLSLGEIARRLNEKGITTTHGKHWARGSLYFLLTSEDYIGTFQFCHVANHFPDLAIVEPYTFVAAQDRLERNRQLSGRNATTNRYLLSGFIRCECGHALVGRFVTSNTTAKQDYKYLQYFCRGRSDNTNPDRCREKPLRADKVDAMIWDWLVSTLDDDTIKGGLTRLAQRKAGQLAPMRARLDQVEKMIESADKKIKRLITELAGEDDDILRAAVRAEVKNITHQREGLTKEQASLTAEIERSELTQHEQAQILATVSDVQAKIIDATFAQKRFVLDRLDVQVKLRTDDTGRWLDVSWGVNDVVTPIEFIVS